MRTQVLEGGFANFPVDASHAFRAVMTAMARPGEIFQVSGAMPPAPMSVAAGVVLLTLCDPETPIYLAGRYDTPQIREWITFHTGAPFGSAHDAMFALGIWDDLPLQAFPIGSAEYPDRSATLIIECAALANAGAVLQGPGIEATAQLSLPETRAFQQNTALFPLGLDFVFTCDKSLAALPRTTRVS